MKRSFHGTAVVLIVLALTAGLVFAAKTCPDCGTSNKDADRFCKSCGAKLPEVQAPRPAMPRLSGASAVDGAVVRITSQPPGAGVNIDGRDRGQTPLDLNDLEPGRHEYELTQAGYRPFYGEFTITGSFGSLVITTEPVGAEVVFDSVAQGPAPDGGLVLTRVPYGRHTVTARLEGYDDVMKTIDLNSAGPVGVTCRLGYGIGWLVVRSEPPGANLFVNDRASVKTPYVGEFEPARYTLRLLRRGYYDWTGEANVQYSESTMVRAVLDRVPTRRLPLLAGALVGLSAGIFSAVMGESEYAKYQASSTPDDTRRYRKSTAAWDVGRDVALAAGVALGGAWWTLKW